MDHSAPRYKANTPSFRTTLTNTENKLVYLQEEIKENYSNKTWFSF